MSDVTESPGPAAGAGSGVAPRTGPTFVGTRGHQGQSLADVLERVLDKGVVIVGDIQVRLLDIELLTIKVRLMVASVERAREMGINWWEGDSFVSAPPPDRAVASDGSPELERRLAALERQVGGGAGSHTTHDERERRDERA